MLASVLWPKLESAPNTVETKKPPSVLHYYTNDASLASFGKRSRRSRPVFTHFNCLSSPWIFRSCHASAKMVTSFESGAIRARARSRLGSIRPRSGYRL
jgi:hypothetical protein